MAFNAFGFFLFLGGGRHVCVLFKNKTPHPIFPFSCRATKLKLTLRLFFASPFSPFPEATLSLLNFLEVCGPQSISGSCDGPWRSVPSLGPSRCCFLLSFLLETVGCLWGEMSGPVKILPQPLTLSQSLESCQARKPNPLSIHTHRLFPEEARTM